jgi:hypothetical protein
MTQQRKNARNPKQQEARGPLWYIQRLIIKERGMNKMRRRTGIRGDECLFLLSYWENEGKKRNAQQPL